MGTTGVSLAAVAPELELYAPRMRIFHLDSTTKARGRRPRRAARAQRFRSTS
jgi:hypothetical protein